MKDEEGSGEEGKRGRGKSMHCMTVVSLEKTDEPEFMEEKVTYRCRKVKDILSLACRKQGALWYYPSL